MSRIQTRSFIFGTAVAALVATGFAPQTASADTVSGTITFTGTVSFSAPIAGITLDDLTVSSGPGIEATGNGEHCDITSNDSVGVDGTGNYPESGALTVGIDLTRNGNQAPDGTCLVQLQAGGNDGGSVSARGTVTVEVTLADLNGNATVVADEIVVRQSKTVAGVDSDCLKYLKKQAKFRGKCNYALWKLGPVDGALKCKNEIEPVGCDPADYVEAVLALSFGGMDQQTDPGTASAVNTDAVGDQSKCQRYIGKAAANFFAIRNKLVQKRCVEALADNAACREQATSDARAKLSLIDNCIQNQAVDVDSGLQIADLGEPCKAASMTGLSLDRKLLKDCFEFELSTLSDGVVGDTPVCGNGVEQAGEACDDGNVTSGDCCSAVCAAEPTTTDTCGVGACQVTATCTAGEQSCTPGLPSPEAGFCADSIDNDCDGLTDGADSDCP